MRLLLQYEFFKENKDNIPREIFSSDIVALYDILCATHTKLERDLSKDDLQALYFANNPTLTQAKKENITQLLDTLPETLDADVAKEVLKKAWITEAGRKLADIGIQIINNKPPEIEKARKILERLETGQLSTGEELEKITDDLEEILLAVSSNTKWQFHLPELRAKASGLGPGIFSAIFGLTESGKSAYAISMMASPGGFADQGANICFYCNEENAIRTKARAVMCYTGMPLLELTTNIEKAKDTYSKIKDNLQFFNCKEKNIIDIEAHIKKVIPDIIVLDQLDKLEITGSFAREDERLGKLYIKFREILDKYDCAGVGVSQANADADNKSVLSTTNMALARISKAAEVDILFGIGKNSLHDDNTRIINILKNKITGEHGQIVCQIVPEISRYVA